MAKRIFKLPGADAPVEIELERIDGETHHGYAYRRGDVHLEIEIDETDPDSGVIRHQGRVLPYHAACDGDTIEIWLAGRRYVVQRVERTARRAASEAASAAAGDITAAMPGTILKILVKPGDAFTPQQPLIIMESMKMEITLSSPHAGRVKAIDCTVGEMVEMGERLVAIEPLGEGES